MVNNGNKLIQFYYSEVDAIKPNLNLSLVHVAKNICD